MFFFNISDGSNRPLPKPSLPPPPPPPVAQPPKNYPTQQQPSLPPKVQPQRSNAGPPPIPPAPPKQMNGHRMNGGPPISSTMYPEGSSSDFENRFRFPDHRSLPLPPKFYGGPRTYPSNKMRNPDAPSAMPPAPPPPMAAYPRH